MEYRKLTDYDRRATAMLAELSADWLRRASVPALLEKLLAR